ncbi:hypothetical protein [uncultured Rikenella sp.]|uniref:hypothetical protein n=1 Tax=uncultured Rikenella sp. TaxID=368003 RepID=UPI0025DBAB45|nr:hypothetical protein [uncultured Rikenella sp.]
MKTQILRTLCMGLALLVSSVTFLQAEQPVLERVLQRSVVEHVQMPLVFSTRDSLFALSLPTADEGPAEVYVQLTVGRNGRVKEKKTRVGANHVGQYVAPAFIAAAKGLRIDRDSVPALTGRDTSVVLTFPLEYRCVLDTVSKKPFGGDDWMRQVSKRLSENSYYNAYRPMTLEEIDKNMHEHTQAAVSTAEYYRNKTEATRVCYYLVFLGDSKY